MAKSKSQHAVSCLLAAARIIFGNNPKDEDLGKAVQWASLYADDKKGGRDVRRTVGDPRVIDYSRVEEFVPGGDDLWDTVRRRSDVLGEAIMQAALLTLINRIFVDNSAPLYEGRSVRQREDWCRDYDLSLKKLVECWAIVEDDFHLPESEYFFNN